MLAIQIDTSLISLGELIIIILIVLLALWGHWRGG